MWANAEEGSRPTLVEANEAFLPEYLHEAVENATIGETFALSVRTLVVEPCRDDIERGHE